MEDEEENAGFALPDEMVFHILLYVPYSDLASAFQTCQQTRRIAWTLSFWRAKAIYDLQLKPEEYEIWGEGNNWLIDLENQKSTLEDLNSTSDISMIGRHRYIELMTLLGDSVYPESEFYAEPARLLALAIEKRNFPLIQRFSGLTLVWEPALSKLARTFPDNPSSEEWNLLYQLIMGISSRRNMLLWRYLVMEGATHTDNIVLLAWALDHRSPQISLNRVSLSPPTNFLHSYAINTISEDQKHHLIHQCVRNNAAQCLLFLRHRFQYQIDLEAVEIASIRPDNVVGQQIFRSEEQEVPPSLRVMCQNFDMDDFKVLFPSPRSKLTWSPEIMNKILLYTLKDLDRERTKVKVNYLYNLVESVSPKILGLMLKLRHTRLFIRFFSKAYLNEPQLKNLYAKAINLDNYLAMEKIMRSVSSDSLILNMEQVKDLAQQAPRLYHFHLNKKMYHDLPDMYHLHFLPRCNSSKIHMIVKEIDVISISEKIRLSLRLENEDGALHLLRQIPEYEMLVDVLWRIPTEISGLGIRTLLTGIPLLRHNMKSILDLFHPMLDALGAKQYDIVEYIRQFEMDDNRDRLITSLEREHQIRSYIYSSLDSKMTPDHIRLPLKFLG